MAAGRTTYKSKVARLEDDMVYVGAVSDPAKFSKSQKNIETYIQKTFRSPDNMVKMLHQMKKVFPQLPNQAEEAGSAMLR
jgi:hypothetical protein